jgi:hypothetical protein
MSKRVSVFLALAFALIGTQCWANIGPQTCTPSESNHCTNTFSPGVTEGVYDFTGTGDGKLTVDFVNVLTTFTLTVSFTHTIDPLDPHVFPEGTVCTTYSGNGSRCDQYDFTGNAGGPHGVPVKGADYRGLITLTLIYTTNQLAQKPAFGHAPGDITTFTVDILTNYSPSDFSTDPTKRGKLPGLSSVVSLDEPLDENDCFQFVSPTKNQSFTVGQEVEVEFQLFRGAACTGKPIRDKDARLSLAMVDPSNGAFLSFPRIRNDDGGNKFQFDPKDGVNERELDTEGLAPGKYTITVFSDEFPPHSVSFFLAP